MHNLLLDPIFRADTSEGPQCLSLPALLAALGADGVSALPGLQRHQEDAFHIFLCYLAGAVLARTGQNEPRQNETFWREGLRKLAGRDDDCAWTLVVDDPTLPAFLQSPVVSKAGFEAYKVKAETPDELDVLQTAKNHDVKARRNVASFAEAWVYTLVSLQTMTGLMGRGNYGIARMNSGTGSRLCSRISYGTGPSQIWRRETAKLLAYRSKLLRGAWGYRDDGHVLTWNMPWDGRSALAISALDPFFIEIARAVRLVSLKDEIQAYGTGTDGTRIAAKEIKGLLGDPWTPVVDDGKEQKAWTVMSRFSVRDLRDLVIGKGRLLKPAMQALDSENSGVACTLKVSVLAPGGMGKTNGFHEAEIPIPGKAAGWLARQSPESDRLAKRSEIALNDAGAMQNKVLKPALYSLLEAGPEQINFDKREVSAWVDQTTRQFAEAWADRYFPWLWDSLDEGNEDAARLQWLKALRDMAWQVLQDAMARLPLRTGRGYRSRVRAEAVFHGCLYNDKNFPELKPAPKKESSHDDSHRADHAI